MLSHSLNLKRFMQLVGVTSVLAFGALVCAFASVEGKTVSSARAGKGIKDAKPSIHNSYIGIDDGANDPSFAAFRTRLLRSIELQDVKIVQQCLSTGVETGIGAASGKAAFTEKWQGLNQNSLLWSRLKMVLIHGAQFDIEADEFHAPAVSFEDSHSDYPQGIVWTKNALLHKKPEETSGVVKSLYNLQLTILEPKERRPIFVDWLKVKTPDGNIGFIKHSDVYSSFDEFAVFKKEKGEWCLSWFGFAEL